LGSTILQYRFEQHDGVMLTKYYSELLKMVSQSQISIVHVLGDIQVWRTLSLLFYVHSCPFILGAFTKLLMWL